MYILPRHRIITCGHLLSRLATRLTGQLALEPLRRQIMEHVGLRLGLAWHWHAQLIFQLVDLLRVLQAVSLRLALGRR